jgi:5-(carboxyamino)imidazole ribonucleotide synthase
VSTIGILGGGQLGRMLALAARPLGVGCRFLDPAADACAGEVGELVVGAYDDAGALAALAAGADALTYEFESVSAAALDSLGSAVPVHPATAALRAAGDRLREKELFRELGIPVAPFAAVDSEADVPAALDAVGLPALLKTRRFGYDGKGQALVRDEPEARAAAQALAPAPLLAEAHVAFRRELSVLAVRGRDGEVRSWPLVENRHARGILRLSLAPATVAPALEAAAARHACALLERLGYVGVLALELFDAGDVLLANEMAPRVHNSGHWTIEGAQTSQFENHLRAVLGLPLGSPEAIAPCAMVNLVGTLPETRAVLAVPGAHLHLYGKTPRPGRKLGHVTLRARAPGELEEGLAVLGRLLGG